MQTKTFHATNMTEAMRLVKAELGPDAMIISSRRERRGGIFGFFSKPVFCITATAGAVPRVPSVRISDEGDRDDSTRNEFRKSMIEPLARELKDLKGKVDALLVKDADTGVSVDAIPPLPERDEKKDTLSERISFLLSDVGMDGSSVETLTNKVKGSGKPVDGEGGLTSRLEEAVESSVRCSGPIRLKKNGTKIVALVGPTGVGKTTTVAKLAALYTVNRKAKIALVTVDTFRVGAVEQLKTYSRIMGLPLEVASTPKELEQALAAHADKDLILIDTVGRSPKDRETIESLRRMLDSSFPIEIHLCLAATTRERELRGVVESFKALPVSRLLFTKLDESSSFGSIAALQLENKLSLSYLTGGQRVPEDIEPATAKKVAGLIFGRE